MNSRATESYTTVHPLTPAGRDLMIAGCQVNPVVLRIRDNGPALLDGEFWRDATAALLQLQAANTGTTEAASITDNQSTQPQVARQANAPHTRLLNTMIISVLTLSVSLFCVGIYAWQQKHQVTRLEAELLLLKAVEDDR